MMIFSNVINRTLSSTIARTPTIRFRYGAARDQQKGAASAAPAPPSPGGKAAPVQPGEPIYDFQLPPRWKRRLLSDEEIAYINRGGPE